MGTGKEKREERKKNVPISWLFAQMVQERDQPAGRGTSRSAESGLEDSNLSRLSSGSEPLANEHHRHARVTTSLTPPLPSASARAIGREAVPADEMGLHSPGCRLGILGF